MDNETDKVQVEGQMVSNYVQSDGWRYTKDLFLEEVKLLESIRSLAGVKREDILPTLAAREAAIEIILEIIAKVEGRAEQHEMNKNLVNPNADEIVVHQK